MILVVEDDSTARRVMVDLLRSEGHEAVAVPNGRQAVEALARVQPQLLILDYGLPDMSGLDVLHEVDPASSPPVIALVTAEELGRRARDDARQLGARIFRKPLSAGTFLSFVRAARSGLA